MRVICLVDFRRSARRGWPRNMFLVAVGGWFCCAPVRSQDGPLDFSFDEFLQKAEELIDQHLQGDTLNVNLPEPDSAQMDQFFRDFQEQLQGEYIVDLAPFKAAADFLLPLLAAHEELSDLGAWLQARRDYFDAIEELQVVISPPGIFLPNRTTNSIPEPAGEASALRLTNSPPPVQTNRPNSGPTPLAPAPAVTATNRVTVEVVLGREGDDDPLEPRPQLVPRAPANLPTAPEARPNLSLPAAPAVSGPPAAPTVRQENPPPATVRTVWAHQFVARKQPVNAATLVPRLKPIFADEGVPTELVWLAEVESGFNARARSPVGAVGLYQLMPTTAKGLGLDTFPFDERKDPEKSGRAAAQLLRQLYQRFGDWRLALAAYNAGPTRVQNLLVSQGARTFDEIARKLPAETQLYVPKVEAAVYQREGVRLENLGWSPSRKRSPSTVNELSK